MKQNKLLIVIVFVLISKAGLSQNKFLLGVSSGINYTTSYGSEYANGFFDSGFSYQLGVTSEYKLNESLSLKAELSYDRQRIIVGENSILYNSEDPVFTSLPRFEQVFHYLALPILVKYKFQKENSFFINGGFSFGYLINAVRRTEVGSNVSYRDLTSYDSFTFGAVLGVGKEIKLNTKHNLTLELRNTLGLNNFSDFETLKLNSLSFILGWNFTL
ncbi:porin family protein [uncultured Tenacibaculum sp.]|uniref:porin family protein n=1 Tax=uncultured Tenacibaculum sp. TaxID=174713 RepID=UPI00260F658C|nr:porin family protein [uncultured Tenacibaculum sp.]